MESNPFNQSQGRQAPKHLSHVMAIGAGIFIFVIHHLIAADSSRVYPMLLLLSSLSTVLGVTGYFFPQCLRALGREGGDLPLRFKVGGLVACLAAIAVWIALWLFVYPTEDLEPVLRWLSSRQ